MVLTNQGILKLSIASAFFFAVASAGNSVLAGDVVPESQFAIDPSLRRIRMLMVEKRYKEAKAPLEVYLKRKPRSALALLYRSRCFVDGNQYREALQDLKAAEKIDPTNCEVHGDEANIYAMLKQYDNAIAAASASIKYRRGNQNKNMFHLRSMMYSAKGQYPKAIEDMTAFIDAAPDKYRAYAWRGTAYEQNQQMDRAIADYRTALKKSGNYEYRFYIARAFQKMGRMNDAVAEMTAVVKQNPEEDEAWIKRATLYFDMAKYKEAIHDYTQALETSFGSNETIYRARARAYEKLGQKDLAQKDLKKAEELQKKPTVSPI
jgi:tetratricopeptide (TPR) repeat protein